MEKINKMVYKLDRKDHKAEGMDNVDKQTLKEIEDMSKSPKWEQFLKEVNKKYKGEGG